MAGNTLIQHEDNVKYFYMYSEFKNRAQKRPFYNFLAYFIGNSTVKVEPFPCPSDQADTVPP